MKSPPASALVIRDNGLKSDSGDGPTTIGIECDVASDRAKGNAIKGFTTAIVGCSNDGNVIKP